MVRNIARKVTGVRIVQDYIISNHKVMIDFCSLWKIAIID